MTTFTLHQTDNAIGGRGGYCAHCRNCGNVAVDPRSPQSVGVTEPDDPAGEYVVTAHWRDGTTRSRSYKPPPGENPAATTAAVRQLRERLAGEPGLQYGIPCPMCRVGEKVAVGRGWRWSDPFLTGVSWENGLTVRHRRRCQFARGERERSCGLPAVEQWCDYHAVDGNRGAARVEPRRLADVVGGFGGAV